MQPPPIRQVILLGASARAAAVSARAAGLDVRAVDRFGDRDLRALCHAWHPLPPEGPPLDLIAQLPPHPTLLLGGCESWLSAFAELERQRPLAAASAAQWRHAKHRQVLQELALAAAIRFPETWSPGDPGAPPAGQGREHEARWVVKQPFRSGGLGVQWWTGGAIDPASYLQAWIPGTPQGAAYLADSPHCTLLGVTAALGRATLTHPAVYAGAVGPLPLDQETETTLRRLGTIAAKRLNLRGLFNIDLVRHPVHGWFLLELNLRYSASMELLDSSSVPPPAGRSLIGRHLNAFGYRLPPSATRELEDGLPASGPVRCKRVLYAPAALLMQGRLFARLERLIRSHRAGWADLPMEGTKIVAGAPFCTILTSGQSEHDARQQAAEVAQAVEKTLHDASQAGSQ